MADVALKAWLPDLKLPLDMAMMPKVKIPTAVDGAHISRRKTEEEEVILRKTNTATKTTKTTPERVRPWMDQR